MALRVMTQWPLALHAIRRLISGDITSHPSAFPSELIILWKKLLTTYYISLRYFPAGNYNAVTLKWVNTATHNESHTAVTIALNQKYWCPTSSSTALRGSRKSSGTVQMFLDAVIYCQVYSVVYNMLLLRSEIKKKTPNPLAWRDRAYLTSS